MTSNPDSCVEICLSEYELFKNDYENIIDFYSSVYPGRVMYRGVKVSGVVPNSVRFIVQPRLSAEYVYIGDVDIMLLESGIAEYGLSFMKKHNADFFNILRNDHQLTGLHFMEYSKMYPVRIPRNVNLASLNDEVLLCSLMREKNCKFPPLGLSGSERRIFGAHISMFSRPPLQSLTTRDRKTSFPAWDLPSGAEKYCEVRYSGPVVEFTGCIKETQVELRRVIQMADMFAYYTMNAHD